MKNYSKDPDRQYHIQVAKEEVADMLSCRETRRGVLK